MSGATEIQNLKDRDPFADEDEESGQNSQSQEKIHIRIQQRNGRKTLTTVQGIPTKFDHKKILKVIKKEFACNGTIISSAESKGMGEVIQLQGDHRLKIKEFLADADAGLGLDEKTIKIHGF
ncbi:translation initiation factor SUI1-domain-containing protein [Chaetomium sp. MPI-SDFR-AT-0129]|uniref:Translation initiation factor SUI1-domain-containing protein n=1 Tax=Dichotomopilus funicola TaxID=1934379 RepID=A0AAN6V5T4_9PEZI|nr:translation initiation factor SUI1-domain-containing protein [Chaetomium sp. MPI-SDFR-AT-0129]KAK4145408.1 translation initiation factor SUI1-domain-containing protein [Dichotomopilus funicola]